MKSLDSCSSHLHPGMNFPGGSALPSNLLVTVAISEAALLAFTAAGVRRKIDTAFQKKPMCLSALEARTMARAQSRALVQPLRACTAKPQAIFPNCSLWKDLAMAIQSILMHFTCAAREQMHCLGLGVKRQQWKKARHVYTRDTFEYRVAHEP